MDRQAILAIAKPILFNTEMVRALLESRKTATRRVVKPQPELKGRLWTLGGAKWSDGVESVCPMIGHSLYDRIPYKPGDYLYVRETWGKVECRHCPTELCSCCPSLAANFNYGYIFRADDISLEHAVKWRPSIHMPKEAARIFLRVTDVRVERLRNIDHASKIAAEGVDIGEHCRQCIDNYGYPCCTDEDEDGGNECGMLDDIRCNFAYLWDSTIKKRDFNLYGWKANPWVWVIEFERVMI